MKCLFYLMLFIAILPNTLHAQDSMQQSKKYYSRQRTDSKLNSTATKLKSALETDNETTAAQQYEHLSGQFEQKGDYKKAEEYLSKALQIYSRQGNKNEEARVGRAIAKLQEQQNQVVKAINSYERAAANSTVKSLEMANDNDAKRLQNKTDPAIQESYAKKNVEIFKKEAAKEEVIDAYKTVAATQLEQKSPEKAAESIKKALDEAPKESETSRRLNKQLADVYASDNQTDKAIDITKAAIDKSIESGDISSTTDQLIDLAILQAKNKEDTDAIATLKKAYELAISGNQTLKAKVITDLLAKNYEGQNRTDLSLLVYKDFIRHLDSLIKHDSSLLDAKLFELTENRIQELEQEKLLQAALIKKTVRFNYVLIGSIILVLLFLLLIARSLKAIKIKNKKIALQSLRREMNPHFIFNSLNSVNQYIAENNELEANRYLSSYSGLMRNIMEHSNKDFVSISTELEQLDKYLELEHRRFSDKFDYDISIDESIDTDALIMPNMIIQPHLENAIWHGLRYKPSKGRLSLQFIRQGTKIMIRITDDGIGLTQSRLLKTRNQQSHESRGLGNTKERIRLLNDLYRTHITMSIQETERLQGTEINIEIPVLHKIP